VNFTAAHTETILG